MLRSIGFKGSSGRFRVDDGDYRVRFDIQRSVHNDQRFSEFTFNVGAAYEPMTVGGGYWWGRFGQILPVMGDTWWTVPAGSDSSDFLWDFETAVRHFLALAVAALFDDPGYPDDGRPWPRTLREPGRYGLTPGVGRPRPGLLALQFVDYQLPTYEDLLVAADEADFEHPDHLARGTVFLKLLQHAPGGDARCLPALLRCLEHERRALVRQTVALGLAFVDVPTDDVKPALVSAAEQDSDPAVRFHARYSTRIIEDRALLQDRVRTSRSTD